MSNVITVVRQKHEGYDLMFHQASAIGDASGGGVSAVFDLAPYLGLDDRVWLKDWFAWQTHGTANQNAYMATPIGHWSGVGAPSESGNLTLTTIASTAWVADPIGYYNITGQWVICPVSYTYNPFYLGVRQQSQANIWLAFNTNTDTKIYKWRNIFIVKRAPQ